MASELFSYTFLAVVVLKPFLLENPRIELVFEAVNDEWFPSQDDMLEHELLKLTDSMLMQYVYGYATDILKILVVSDQVVEVEVGW
jgi:hypothetical protein